MPPLPLIGLVLVVKDEEPSMPRLLDSVLPLVDTWTICDTGSTDRTREIARALGKNGRVYRHKWRNFAANLNLAHARAQGTARWLLWLHADMTVDFHDDLRRWLGRQRKKAPDFYWIRVEDHGSSYMLPLLMRGELPWRYVGATHEYLDLDSRRGQRLLGLDVTHHGDGGNREGKFDRDIELLSPAFRKGDARAIFYTAESHRFAGRDEQAALIYDVRANLNGFEEERWYARYQAARLRGDPETLIEAWRERPWRHEPLSAAARIIAAQSPDAYGDLLFLERPPD